MDNLSPLFFEGQTIDDLLNTSFQRILKNPGPKIESTKGPNFEILGAFLRLTNPLARLSSSYMKGKAFSTIGETLWYLSGSNELKFIEYYIRSYKDYSDDDKTLFGAYGPRIIGTQGFTNQLANVVKTLKRKPNTRQAVIQLLSTHDLVQKTKDTPCTISLQFFIRDSKLHMFTNMRSNDMYNGFIHDVFFYTILQEMIARKLGIALGNYNHFVSSFHLYEKDFTKAQKYLQEGYQSTKNSMPEMPAENIDASMELVLNLEKKIRTGVRFKMDDIDLHDYWKDILYLLYAYRTSQHDPKLSKKEKKENLNKIQNKLSHDYFTKYILEKTLSLEND
jgi:thymidylate synthase